MPNVEGAYCAEEDLRTGDIMPPSYSSKTQYIKNAAEEIDAAIGHIYVTPVAIADLPVNRPSILFLKKLNWLLASGRFILDVAAAGESDTLHAYGKRMLDEATAMLALLTSRELKLTGADPIEGSASTESWSGPMIFNEDSESLVEGFYSQRKSPFTPGESYPYPPKQVIPYG